MGIRFDGATFDLLLEAPDQTAGNSTVNWPNLAGATDVPALVALAQTLTNKSIDIANNTLTGTFAQFNTAVSDATLVDLATSQTLTNKSVDLASNTLTGTTALFNTALSDGSFATLAGSETLTNKSIDLASNTLTGTTALFNTALSDGSFATLAGSETFTNKTFGDALAMGGFAITGLLDGVNPQDATTKAQLDAGLNGLSWKAPVDVASTANMGDTAVYDNGTAGVGATLTAQNNGDINIDAGYDSGTHTAIVGSRILVKDQSAGLQNGIYEVTVVGVIAATQFVLTRVVDNDTDAEMASASTFVQAGGTNGDKAFTQTADSFTMGTTPGVWSQFAGSGGDHGAQTGLGDDDHTQYALLAGRTGGQELIGGDAISENLTLKSTSHATVGSIIIGAAAGENVVPGADSVGSIGVTGTRWANGFFDAATITDLTTGDLNMHHPSNGQQYRIVEQNDGLVIEHKNTGKQYLMAMNEITPRDLSL